MSWSKKDYLPMTYVIAIAIESGDILAYEEAPSRCKEHKVWNFKDTEYRSMPAIKIVTNIMTREQAITHLESLRLFFKKEIKANVISDVNDQGHLPDSQEQRVVYSQRWWARWRSL